MAAHIAASLGATRFWSVRNVVPSLGLISSCSASPLSSIHTSSALERSRGWEKKNKVVHPPQLPDEPRRPAEIHHCRRQIKYSKDKMWYLAKLIRGMSIDQALGQLQFNDKKGAKIIKEVLLEAQDMAVKNFNVEYKSNLYIGKQQQCPDYKNNRINNLSERLFSTSYEQSRGAFCSKM
uniref:Large ribosomal subunit protein uL22m n=1 Tax=Geotrypetes seraphini TaxID=260995 RepID=A0A6P8PHX6_GEOSA|nr:39S ribosomal protein L22, mitochondrial isoform X3 [Geotrypetes seraphini]